MRPLNRKLRQTLGVLSLVVLSACDSDGDMDMQAGMIQADDDAAVVQPRALEISDPSLNISTVTQCFCLTLYRDTLIFHHFRDQRAVLVINFDNQSLPSDGTAEVVLFDPAESPKLVDQWINNQHSDGLYINIAQPLKTHTLDSDAVTVTAAQQTGTASGDAGDSYDSYRIEFTVSDQSLNNEFFLNGFSADTVLHVQRTAIE